MRKQEEGFTLIELVIVIVILGILAAVGIPRYLDLRTEAQDATKNKALATVASAIAIAAARNRAAPLSPTVAHVLAELPGATCAVTGAAAYIRQGKTETTLIASNSTADTALPNCTAPATTATLVVGVGTGVYSA